jgi:Amt family ammonium transporter
MLNIRITDVFATKSVSAAGHDALLPGNSSFLLLKVNAMAIAAGYSSCVSFLTFKFINFILPRCASSKQEQIGHDASQHNEKYLKGNIADSYDGNWRSSLTT